MSLPPIDNINYKRSTQGYSPSNDFTGPLGKLKDSNKTTELSPIEQLYTARGSQGWGSEYYYIKKKFLMENLGTEWD